MLIIIITNHVEKGNSFFYIGEKNELKSIEIIFGIKF